MDSSASTHSNKDVQQTPASEQSDSSLFTWEAYDFKAAEHSTYALTNMYEMYQLGQLCDVILKVGSETFKAHRVVLASVSPYFFSMFNGEIKEQVYSEIVLYRRDIDPAGMKLLLDYAYTGKITITTDNVRVLLSGSVLLEMQEVREACCHFLTKQLRPTNCLGIRRFADTVSCKELMLKSHCFIMENFQEVLGTEEFLLLAFNEVEELVSNKQIYTSSEEDVFTAVLNWIKHDVINRRQYIGKLMVHVRLRLVNRKFLMTVVDKEALMHEDSQCMKLLFETMRYHLDSDNASDLATSIIVEGKPKEAEPYLFAIGGLGHDDSILSECEVYNPRSDSWATIAPMLSKRRELGATGLHGLLYAFGGYDGTSKLATAECYNPLINTWTSITPMSTARSNLGVCSLDGLIYACGGTGGNPRSMEKFDPSAGLWYTLHSAMSIERKCCQIAAVENCIYAVGGALHENDTVEKFDPRVENWSPVPSMSSRRCFPGVAVIDGHLYCIGGWYSRNALSSGERFDVRKNAWEPISAMHNRRWRYGIVAIDGCIYAVGGSDGSSYLNSVEKYDSKTNKWSVVSCMITARACTRAAVLD